MLIANILNRINEDISGTRGVRKPFTHIPLKKGYPRVKAFQRSLNFFHWFILNRSVVSATPAFECSPNYTTSHGACCIDTGLETASRSGLGAEKQ